jgi:processive 1,2-diacylglycerol beta-glucosyltransferase
MVRSFPSLWGRIYESLERKAASSRSKRLITTIDRMSARGLVAAAQESAPDRIVCTHFMPAEVFAERRRRGQLAAPVYVTLTDYDIHTMWIQPGVDGYFVASEEMAYALRAKGVGKAQVTVTGIPIDPLFSRQPDDRRAMRTALGLNPDAPTVLLSAGGFGFVRVDELVATMSEEMTDAQFLVVAGKNKRLHEALTRAAARLGGRVVPFGFVTNMHELMAASDLAVTKPGGLTSSECLATGVPMVIVNPIPGQEERNTEYFLENGVAVRARSAAHLIYKTGALLADPARLASMRAAARRLARPRAAFDIAAAVVRGETAR